MIIVAGDSWAAGEFCPKPHTVPVNQQVLHQGLTQFLINDGHQLLNLATPAGCNLANASKIRYFLMTNPGIKVDKIFMFQTDWERDVYNFTDFGMPQNLIKNGRPAPWPGIGHLPPAEHANSVRDILLSRFYQCLSEITTNFSVKIHLIGGLSDLLAYSQFEFEYPGVVPACKSLVNLVTNGCPEPVEPTTGFLTYTESPLVDELKKQLPTEAQTELLHQLDLALCRFKLFRARPDLFPDGYHGGRVAHGILFDFLKSTNVV